MSAHFLNSRFGIALRTVARRSGLVRLLRPVLQRKNYEEAFSTRLLGEIRHGDRVWDVGANVGYYTKQFASAVGMGGRVIAFEPSPQTFQELSRAVAMTAWVKPLNVALSASTGKMGFVTSPDPLGVTHRIARPGETANHTVEVRMGDDLVREDPSAIPNVVKIDVEGFEDDVLAGMREILRNPALRAVFVEVHFREMADRGRPNGPNDVVEQLTAAGLTTTWLDLSHLWARRG